MLESEGLLRHLLLLVVLAMGLQFSAQPLAAASVDPLVIDESAGIPAGLIYENLKNPYLLWVDLAGHRLHLLERTDQHTYIKLKTLPISLGKQGYGKEIEGDQKTPIGVYQVTSFLPDKQLNDYYGHGAYPVNFPNIWDRLLNRTGYGIWLHGLPKGVDSRPPEDSDGCIIIDNKSLEQLDDYIERGQSIVVFSPSLEWLSPDATQSASDILMAIEKWRSSWEKLDEDAYLANYHDDFSDTKRDLKEWSVYKSRINRLKRFIGVDLSEMSVIDYPGEENLVAVRFYQDYRSSNFNWRGWKHMLWRRNSAGDWRILYEGNG